MKKLPSKILSNPFPRFRDTSNIMCMTYRDGEHCPDNKRSGEVKSVLELKVLRCDKHDEPWVELQAAEYTTSKNGRVAGRTISTVMTLEMAKRIAKFINEGT